jgi:hypothetical protein
VTLSGKHRLRVLENRVLWRIFGPKRNQVIGDWTKLNNEELHNLYSSHKYNNNHGDKEDNMIRHVARMRENMCTHSFCRKP